MRINQFMNSKNINQLSEQLLLHVKLKKETAAIKTNLADLDLKTLVNSLVDDDMKKAFWINIYNAYYLILRKEMKVTKPDIYKKKLFVIAGKSLSLDDVEHGILRKYRYKYALGFVKNLFPKRFIKQLAVDKIDYRIHFALNCGAESCPPIAFYNIQNIDGQLDMATQSFLEGETEFDEVNKIAYITRLFQWYLGDFDGLKGVKVIFKEQLKKDISNYKIKYKTYNWDDNLDNFVDI
jgi:hypothetical protein